VAIELSRILPSTLAYRIARWKNIALMTSTYRFALRWPELAKKTIAKHVRRQLGDACEVDPHFTPRYAPWRQRLCVAPDGDLFATIREGRARVVTDEIETFTEHGIRLRSGEDLEADVVVAATGIDLEVLGGIDVRVDAAPVDFSKTLYYKGVMFSGVPNLASVFGYIGASWTLKADLICSYVARLIAYMDRNRYVQVVPRDDGAGEMSVAPFVEGFTPGYVRRSLAKLPKQRASAPWRVHQNYFADVLTLKYAPIRNRALRFARSPKRPSIDPSVLAADNR
jgi:cation diffusion facilitator CzcD-associated flavoprotein CzcO